MRRILASAVVLALVAVFMVSAMGSGSGVELAELQDRVRQRLRPGHRRRLQGGRRQGRVDLQDRPALGLPQGQHLRLPRAGHRVGHPGRLRLLPPGRLLPVAAAVAHRRVLRRLPAGLAGRRAQAGLDDPGQPHAVDDPDGSAQRRDADALPRASHADHQRARRGGRRTLG